MDHIPYPVHPGVSPIVVPYLGTYEFDHGDFSSFDERLGIENTTLSAHQYAGLAQAWLYFGFLETFIGRKIDKRRFLRRAGASETVRTEYVVDSSALPGLLENQVREFRKKYWWHEPSQQMQHWRRTLASAQIELAYIQKACEWDGIEWDDTCSAIFLSINILEVTLRDFYFRMDTILSVEEQNWGGYPRAMNKRMPNFNPVLQYRYHDKASPGALLLMKRMKEVGWCEHQTVLFLDNVDFVIGYYLSSIPRCEDVTHERCTEDTCIAYNTNNATYMTKHLEGGCECGIVEASDQALNRVISAGGLPLVRIQKGPKGQYLLNIIECKPSTEYTAISHVWIDGLGNPKANGLPNCQIEKLAEQLVQLQRSQEAWVSRLWRIVWKGRQTIPLVWLDTLCIPVKPEHNHLREKAINSMSLIYAGAKGVLVLDNELRRIESKDEPIELLHARIFASKWNSRSWTLQEGALAQKCYFQFRDVSRDLEFPELPYFKSFFRLIWRALKSPRWFIVCICKYVSTVRKWFWPLFLRNPPPSGFQTMTHYVQRSFHVLASTHFDLNLSSEVIRLTGFNSRSFSGPTGFSSLRHKFERTWNMLGQRTTTYAQDVHIIIANLVGFSVSQIMEIQTPVDRTKTVLHRIGCFNLGFMCNHYDRPNAAEDSSDRWIPSFPAPDQLDGDVAMLVGEWGITFHPKTKKEDIQLLMISNAASLKSFWIKYSRSRQYSIRRCRREGGGVNHKNHYLHSNEAENHSLENEENTPHGERAETLGRWRQQWWLTEEDAPVPRASPNSSYSTNSKGEHVIHEWYRITCKLPNEDKLDRFRYEDKDVCILLILPPLGGPDRRLRGARLLETGRLQVDGKVHLRYDCPLVYEIERLAPDKKMLRRAPLLSGARELSYKDVVIECDKDTEIQEKYVTRDRSFFVQTPNRFITRRSHLFFIFIMPFIISVGCIIIDALRIPALKTTSTGNRAALVASGFIVYFAMLWLGSRVATKKARVRAFRAWKMSLRHDWRPETEKVATWGVLRWLFKDRKSEKSKRRQADYEMVSVL